MGKNNQKQVNDVPVGAKIISVIYFLFAFTLIIKEIVYSGEGSLMTISRLVLIVLFISIGAGLWKVKNWARIVTIISSILIVIVAILVMTTNIYPNLGLLVKNSTYLWASILIVINVVMIGYLLLNNKVKEAFKLI